MAKAMQQRERWGYISPAGEVVIPFDFDRTHRFFEGLAPSVRGGFWGVIDKSGGWVVEPAFSHVGYFSGGRATVSRNGKFGCIDARGQLVIGLTLEFLYTYSEGLARFEVAGRQGFINADGKAIVPPQFEDAKDFREGLALVTEEKTHQMWYIDMSGRKVLGPFRRADSFFDGLAKIEVGEPVRKPSGKIKGQEAFIDRTGREAFRLPDGVSAQMFGSGLAPADFSVGDPNYPGMHGYIDRQGRWAIEPQFGYAAPFINGCAKVDVAPYAVDKFGPKDGPHKWGLINPEGRFLVPAEFDEEVENFSDGRARFKRTGRYGYLELGGRVVIEPVYVRGESFSDGLASVALME